MERNDLLLYHPTLNTQYYYLQFRSKTNKSILQKNNTTNKNKRISSLKIAIKTTGDFLIIPDYLLIETDAILINLNNISIIAGNNFNYAEEISIAAEDISSVAGDILTYADDNFIISEQSIVPAGINSNFADYISKCTDKISMTAGNTWNTLAAFQLTLDSSQSTQTKARSSQESAQCAQAHTIIMKKTSKKCKNNEFLRFFNPKIISVKQTNKNGGKNDGLSVE